MYFKIYGLYFLQHALCLFSCVVTLRKNLEKCGAKTEIRPATRYATGRILISENGAGIMQSESPLFRVTGTCSFVMILACVEIVSEGQAHIPRVIVAVFCCFHIVAVLRPAVLASFQQVVGSEVYHERIVKQHAGISQVQCGIWLVARAHAVRSMIVCIIERKEVFLCYNKLVVRLEVYAGTLQAFVHAVILIAYERFGKLQLESGLPESELGRYVERSVYCLVFFQVFPSH